MKTENKKFLDDSKNEYKCIIHHIKENTLQQIKDELDDCNEEKKFFKNMKDIQSILLDLVVKGIVDQRLDKKYVLSINGKELLSMIPDPFSKK